MRVNNLPTIVRISLLIGFIKMFFIGEKKTNKPAFRVAFALKTRITFWNSYAKLSEMLSSTVTSTGDLTKDSSSLQRAIEPTGGFVEW